LRAISARANDCAVREKGLTIVPTRLYFKDSRGRLEFSRWVNANPDLEEAHAHAKLAERYWDEQTEAIIRIVQPPNE
jgi:tmRNA-binding protein